MSFLAAALLLAALLWRLRERWRGPLAGMLFFVGTLLPVLGFCNVFPFIYSYVADHFQYLASLGIITLAAAGMARLLSAGKEEAGGGKGRRDIYRRDAEAAEVLSLRVSASLR